MWFFFLHHKSQPFYLASVFAAGGHDIYAGGVNAAVPQNIRKLGNVLFNAIKSTGKELAQIVGEYLGGLDPGSPAKAFHLRPDVASVKGPAVSCDKDSAALDVFLGGVIQ